MMLPRVMICLRSQVDYESETSLPREVEPVKAFARSLARGEPYVTQISAGVPALAWRDDGAIEFTPEVHQLDRGSVLVVKSLRSISDDPLVVTDALAALIGRGISVHVMTLGGSATAIIEPLAELAALAGDLTVKVEHLEIEAERAVKEQARVQFDALRQAIFEAIREGRLPFFGPNAIEAPPSPDEDADIGEACRRARIRRGMSQRHVAEALGIAQSSVSKIETLGSGQYLARVIKLVDPNFGGDPSNRDDRLAWAAAELLKPEPDPGMWRAASSTLIPAER